MNEIALFGKKMKNELSAFCQDWLNEFPHLQRYKNGRKLILRSRTVVFGIELRKIWDDVYRPEFICLNLLSSFNEFSITREFSLPKNPQADIEHRYHFKKYEAVALKIKEETPLLSKSQFQPSDIIELYRESIDYDISRGVNPLCLMTSLIQQSIYFQIEEVRLLTLRRLESYLESLPSDIRDSMNAPIKQELSLTRDELEENMKKNRIRSQWPDNRTTEQAATGQRR